MTLQSMVYAEATGVGKYRVQDGLPRVTATQQNLPHTHIPIIPSADHVIPRFGTDLSVSNTKNDLLFPNKVLQVSSNQIGAANSNQHPTVTVHPTLSAG